MPSICRVQGSASDYSHAFMLQGRGQRGHTFETGMLNICRRQGSTVAGAKQGKALCVACIHAL